MVALALAAGHRVEAWHVDHGLRADSAADAERVAALLSARDVTVRVVRVDVPHGPNLEERAREARYAALPDGIQVAHTADDVAETVLINLLRGTGLDGLGAMQSGIGPHGRRIGRPMLGLRRTEALDVCRMVGWDPLADPMNTDSRFVRVRVRQEVLPLLADVAGRDVVPLLARLASTAGGERLALDAIAAGIDPTDCAALRALDPVMARRALRAWITGDDGRPPSEAEVGRVMEVVRGEVRACELAGGRRVARTAGRLRLEQAASPSTSTST